MSIRLAAATDEIRPITFGPADRDAHGLVHVVTSGMVKMDDKPAEAVRTKPYSSLSVGLCARSVRETLGNRRDCARVELEGGDRERDQDGCKGHRSRYG